MRELVLVGSHLGYPLERVPLGGGAMVGLRLAQAWAREGARLTVVGSGPLSPWPGGRAPAGARYVQVPAGAGDPDLVRLSERGYARFCRRFEAAATDFLLGSGRIDLPRATVVVNDISESPDLARLARSGTRIVSIWHVDVVDYFNRIYLGGVLEPERLTRSFAWLGRRGLCGAVPDLLRLVFEKQEAAASRSDLIVVPSRPMAETIARCYPSRGAARPAGARTLVVPWGGWSEPFPDRDVREAAERLRGHYQIGPGTRVLATLSRISPEKGIHVLLGALRVLEDAREIEDLCLFVCGEAAFMRGASYARRVRAAADGLSRFRVFFPGHLPAFEKQCYLRLAELFVSPSVHESYGLTLVEAMGAGLPILASDHHGVSEILRPSFGRIVPYGEPGREERMARALRELLAGGRLKGMGAAARAASEAMPFERAARLIREAAEAA